MLFATRAILTANCTASTFWRYHATLAWMKRDQKCQDGGSGDVEENTAAAAAAAPAATAATAAAAPAAISATAAAAAKSLSPMQTETAGGTSSGSEAKVITEEEAAAAPATAAVGETAQAATPPGGSTSAMQVETSPHSPVGTGREAAAIQALQAQLSSLQSELASAKADKGAWVAAAGELVAKVGILERENTALSQTVQQLRNAAAAAAAAAEAATQAAKVKAEPDGGAPASAAAATTDISSGEFRARVAQAGDAAEEATGAGGRDASPVAVEIPAAAVLIERETKSATAAGASGIANPAVAPSLPSLLPSGVKYFFVTHDFEPHYTDEQVQILNL